MNQGFSETLLARGPHPSLGEHGHTYSRVIGSWSGQLYNHLLGHSVPPLSVEAHFAWVLEGRAVQDVWITPARDERGSVPPGLDWYGSTLRVFEPSTCAWRSAWTDPVSGLRIELLGRARGDDIVQIGTRGGRQRSAFGATK